MIRFNEREKIKWEYLIVKSDFSKTSYSTNFYYSKDGKEFTNLYNGIDDDKISDGLVLQENGEKYITDEFESMHYDFVCRKEGDEWPK